MRGSGKFLFFFFLGGGGGGVVSCCFLFVLLFCFLAINVFHRGPYELDREAIGPKYWVQLLLEGVSDRIFKETYSHL